MNVPMKKMIGILVLAVALVFLEGLIPERRRPKALPHQYHAKAVR